MGSQEMMYRKLPKLAFLLGLVTMLAACESRTSGSLGYVEPDTPDAQPCGEGCPKVKRVYPILMRMGSLSLSVLRTPSRIVRRAAPMMTASMIASLISCLRVASPDGSGSFCATPCVADDECPLGGHCELFGDGTSACLPDSAAVSAPAGQPRARGNH